MLQVGSYRQCIMIGKRLKDIETEHLTQKKVEKSLLWNPKIGDLVKIKSLNSTGQIVDFDKKKYPFLKKNMVVVKINDKYFRPNEVEHLLGDSTKARNELNWSPKTSFDDLVKLMIDHDLVLAEQEKVLIQNKLMTPTWENPII